MALERKSPVARASRGMPEDGHSQKRCRGLPHLVLQTIAVAFAIRNTSADAAQISGSKTTRFYFGRLQ